MFEGRISVKAALLAKKRNVTKIYIDAKKKDKDLGFILNKAKEYHVPIQLCTQEEIETLAKGKTHGGILAEVQKRTYESLEDIIDIEDGFYVLLEGIEDPYNLGYILRTLYSSGCTGVLLRKRNWDNVEDIIIKASAGAYEYMNIVLCDDLPEAVQRFKDKGVPVYAAMRKDAQRYLDISYTESVLLMVGGEMRGLSKEVLEKADQNIYIPYANGFRNALNASSAVAVLAYEVYRQRIERRK